MWCFAESVDILFSWLCHKFIDIDNRDWTRKSLKIFHHFQLCQNIVNAEDVFLCFPIAFVGRVIVIMSNSFRNVFQFVFSPFTAHSWNGLMESQVGSSIKTRLKAIKREENIRKPKSSFFSGYFCACNEMWAGDRIANDIKFLQICWTNTKLFNVNAIAPDRTKQTSFLIGRSSRACSSSSSDDIYFPSSFPNFPLDIMSSWCRLCSLLGVPMYVIIVYCSVINKYKITYDDLYNLMFFYVFWISNYNSFN